MKNNEGQKKYKNLVKEKFSFPHFTHAFRLFLKPRTEKLIFSIYEKYSFSFGGNIHTHKIGSLEMSHFS